MSSKRDLTISISVEKPPMDVFNAINDVKSWWIGDVEGRADKLGSEFTYRYRDLHRSSQKVKELVPGKKVVWIVTEAILSFAKNKHEWEGTTIEFQISPIAGGTEIMFIHRGLTPEVECYEACSGGWDFYIKKSLKSSVMTGKGLAPEF